MKIHSVCCPLLLFLILTCSSIQAQRLVFQSAFEGSSRLDSQKTNSSDIIGIDTLNMGIYNWQTNLEGAPNFCNFSIQYQGGDDTMRLAEIITDPNNAQNKVLHFWIKHPNVSGTKGRVQGNLYNCLKGMDTLEYAVDLYLPSDIDTLRYLPVTFSFFTLMEFWNNPAWKDSLYGFRMTVNLQKKDSSSNRLHLGVHGQTYDIANGKYIDLWDTTNTTVNIPTQEWITLTVKIIEGTTANGGNFFLSMKRIDGSEQILFDISVDTHHPDAPATKIDGITHFNPFKLYTDSDMVNALRTLGKLLHVYWDNFNLNETVLLNLKNENVKAESFRVGPNPATDFVKIKKQIAYPGLYSLKLINMEGKTLLDIPTIKEEEKTLSVGSLPGGIYLLRIVAGQKLYNQKIVINKK